MVKRLILSVLWLILAGSVSADVYIESTAMGVDSHSWTSGLRNRTEVPVLFLGGRLIVITRLDRGVTWTLDPQQKVYEEAPVAIPYQPDAEPAELRRAKGTLRALWFSPREGECHGTITRLPTTKTFAGYETTGARITCTDGSDEGFIVWLAPVAGMLGQAQRETEAHEAASLKARYANYPPEEQPKAALGMSVLNSVLGLVIGSVLQEGQGLPAGFPMAVEGFGTRGQDGEDQGTMVFEVKQISTSPIGAGLFRVPGGYQRVDNLTETQMRGMLERLKVEGLIDDVHKILDRAEEAEDIPRP